MLNYIQNLHHYCMKIVIFLWPLFLKLLIFLLTRAIQLIRHIGNIEDDNFVKRPQTFLDKKLSKPILETLLPEIKISGPYTTDQRLMETNPKVKWFSAFCDGVYEKYGTVMKDGWIRSHLMLVIMFNVLTNKQLSYGKFYGMA